METTHIKIFSETPIIINRLQALLEEVHIGSFVKKQHRISKISRLWNSFRHYRSFYT